MKWRPFLFFSLILLTASCIQDEALNSEAVIEDCIGSEDVISVEIDADAKTVRLLVERNVDCSAQVVNFIVSEGATIDPIGGVPEDFSSPRQYTVTSEDEKWIAHYTVSFIKANIPSEYHFEDVTLSSSAANAYQLFSDYDPIEGKALRWSSGNKGFELTGVAKSAEDYPTFQDEVGYQGHGLKLVTRSTGFFGTMVGMSLAAGNLFIGSFDATSALTNPLKSTQFGVPFYDIPISLSGYYKYTAGDKYTINGKPDLSKTDIGDIYAIFFETDSLVKMLDGSNSLTSDHLISMARIEDMGETQEWTSFTIPFEPIPGKSIDLTKLMSGGYSVSIVFSSSVDGGSFAGAVGSTLWIDEVTLNYQ